MVGDADPAMMEELIRARFGGWRARGAGAGRARLRPHRRGRASRSPTSLIRARRPRRTWSGCGPMSRSRTPWRASGCSSRRCSPRRSSTAGSRRMRAAQSAFIGAARRRLALAQHRQRHPIVARRARRRLAAGAGRGLCDHRRRAAGAAERGRDRARAAESAHRASPPRSRASRPSSRRSAPSSWSARSTMARWWRRAQTVLDNFEAQCAAMTPDADRRGDAGAVHRLGPAHDAGLAGADRGRRRRRWPRGWRRRGRRRRRRGGAERRVSFDDLPRPGPAGPRGLAPADRGHGRHHRPLRQRLDPDLQADRIRARLGAGAAALRRRRWPGSRPTGRRWAGWPGWSRRRASPGSISTRWSGC